MLYQLMVGDFRKPLSPGWEAEIEDPVLREDIADAACGDPARRLKSAAELADRLDRLDARRVERDRVLAAEQRAVAAERRLAESRARRPWIRFALAALVLGMAASFVLYRKAVKERDIATHQTRIASSVSRFLSNDLLGRSNPFQSGKADETLLDAVKHASPAIDRQFANDPLVAAHLHQAIARALDLRTDYPDAREEYLRATKLFEQTEGALSQHAIVVQLQRAAMEARSYQAGSLEQAKSLLAEQESRITRLSAPRADIPVWLANARGMIALIGNDAKAAHDNFETAARLAASVPSIDENARLAFAQRVGFTNIRLGKGAEAERVFRELIDTYSRTSGAESAEVLRVRLNLAQAFMIQGKNAEAVDETNQIYPAFVSRLGRDHELTMQVLATRTQCEGSLGRWDDAVRDGLELHELAVQKQGPLSFFAIASLSDASLAQCRAGKLQDGEANARRAYEASRKAFGEHAGLTGGTADTLANCLSERNQLDEASKLLDSIDTKAVAQLSGDANWAANVDLARAEIAYRRGDMAGARKQLEPAIAVFSRPDAEPYQKHKLETLMSSLR